MRTLLFTLEFPPFKGGVANYYGHLINHWPLGEDILVLDNSRGELRRDRGLLAWWPAFRALKWKIKVARIDYVLVGQLLPLGTVAWLLSLWRPLKYAVFLHGMDLTYALKSPRKRFLSARILKRADKIICANSYVAAKAKEFYLQKFRAADGEKIIMVNPGVPGGTPNIQPEELAELTLKHGLAGKTVLFSLGRLVRRKGIDKTIEALSLLTSEQTNNLKYYIAGHGPEETYLRQLVAPAYAERITFLGELSEEEKWRWLAISDIFIMPSREIAGDFEGFGIVYLEANLSGKPVIAGRAGGVADAVINEYNGLLVNPEDPLDIGKAIIKLATDVNLRQELGTRGRERALAEFNWEKQAAKIAGAIGAKKN